MRCSLYSARRRQILSQLNLPFTVSLLPADCPTAAFAARGGELGAAPLGPFGGGFRIPALQWVRRAWVRGNGAVILPWQHYRLNAPAIQGRWRICRDVSDVSLKQRAAPARPLHEMVLQSHQPRAARFALALRTPQKMETGPIGLYPTGVMNVALYPPASGIK
jgi:hypothetical protein